MNAFKLTTVSIAELAKRVPPNQIKQFEEYCKKSAQYHRNVNKFPEKLPRINWEYYRRNVREDDIKIIDQFQVKYEELDHCFARRHEALDHSKYFSELEQLTAKVHDEVQKFIEVSAQRIETLEEEIRRLKNLNYENMTMEQFVVLREDIADFIPGPGKELFWPHQPEDQLGAKYTIPMSEEDKKKLKGNQNELESL